MRFDKELRRRAVSISAAFNSLFVRFIHVGVLDLHFD